MSLILNGTTGISDVDGTAAAPALTGTDSNTGIFFPAADTIAFAEGGAEAMRIDSSGNVGIGVTPNAWSVGKAVEVGFAGNAFWGNSFDECIVSQAAYFNSGWKYARSGAATHYSQLNGAHRWFNVAAGTIGNAITWNQAMTLDSSGNLLVGQSSTTTPGAGNTTAGACITSGGRGFFSVSGSSSVFNRSVDDGDIISLRQDGTQEGTISVSGTTVSYNGGHLSRWAQTTAPKDDTLVKGTVLSNLDEMNVYTDADGNPVDNEQLNKVKVSDVEGDANVAGVFVNWTHDDAHDVDEINMAMTGDMIIRIAQGTTVARGDLLMSAGDGTAKPQGDDIVRSKTVAKVTSTHVTCTYADGSYCVPCVLMAC